VAKAIKAEAIKEDEAKEVAIKTSIASPVCWPPISHPYLYIITGVADD
jgi:hypothetical protein